MANTIKIGNIEASAVMIGNSAVSAVYIGSTKIYPSDIPTPPTDNYVLVDSVNYRFENPRKIKVDYSLIEDDNTIIRSDYQLYFPSETYIVVYLNEPTINVFVEQYGWDQEMVTENYLNMVGVVDGGGALAAILEDGVEYTQIGHTSITEMDYIRFGMEPDNPYLYATK